MHATCDAHKALISATRSLRRWSSDPCLRTIVAVEQRRWSTVSTNADFLEEGEGNESSASALRHTQAPGAMYRSTLPVNIKRHASEQDKVGNVKRWHAIDSAARKKQGARSARRNRVTPTGQKQSTSLEGQVAGEALVKKYNAESADSPPGSRFRYKLFDSIDRISKTDNASLGKTSKALNLVGRSRLTATTRWKSTSFEEIIEEQGASVRKYRGQAAHRRPASSGRAKVLRAIMDAKDRTSRKNNAIYNRQQPRQKKRVAARISNSYTGRDFNFRNNPCDKNHENHHAQQRLLTPMSREPETKVEESQSQNQAPAEQILDPFFHDLEPILRMLWDSTPQSATSEEDSLANLDNEFRDGAEIDANETLHGLGDIVDDITYAPRPDAHQVPLRLQWTGAQGTSTGLTLRKRPQSWTQASFERYMRHLVAVGREREQDDQDSSGISAATREAISLLKDRTLMPYICHYTLDVVLAHLCFQQCFEDMMQIFHLLRGRAFAFNGPNFSRFVDAATRLENNLELRPVLKYMLDCGLKPTGHTWYAFYQLISRKYPSQRSYILRTMQKKGLTNNDAPNMKEALIRSLGWIETSESTSNSPRREPHSGNDSHNKFPS